MVIPLYWSLRLLLFLANIVDIEWEISRLVVSVNISNGVTVPVVFQSEEGTTKAVSVFVVLGGIVRASSVRTGCDFAFVSLEAVLTSVVECEKRMRVCVVPMTTLLLLLVCNPMIGLGSFFITTKCSANVLPPTSKLSVAVSKGFSNWPFATSI